MYIKFEHRGLGDDRWLDVSAAAFTTHAWALDYCNEQGTDGIIPTSRAHRLVCPVTPSDLPAAWAELLDAGIWEHRPDAYLCPDFLAYGISADEQNATRGKWAQDKRRRRLHDIGNHQLCTAKSCPVVRTSGGESTRPPVDKWTTRPNQTRPDPEGVSGWDGADPADADAPPDPATEAAARLGRAIHRRSADCCPLPASHPIHAQEPPC